MLRLLGLLLLVSGVVSTGLPLLSSALHVRVCTFTTQSFGMWRELNGTLVVTEAFDLQAAGMEGFRYTLRVWLPSQPQAVCFQLPNASQPYPVHTRPTPAVTVNLTDGRLRVYVLRPSDYAALSALLSTVTVDLDRLLDALDRRAVRRVELDVASGPEWEVELEKGSYYGVIVATFREPALPNYTICHYNVWHNKQVCKTVSPTPAQLARGLLVTALGAIALAYDRRRGRG